uniref:Uncharacterized protein n=1 Tax=Pararge aegeria TaxID=116150 RepID=S4NJ21_9NEOP
MFLSFCPRIRTRLNPAVIVSFPGIIGFQVLRIQTICMNDFASMGQLINRAKDILVFYSNMKFYRVLLQNKKDYSSLR